MLFGLCTLGVGDGDFLVALTIGLAACEARARVGGLVVDFGMECTASAGVDEVEKETAAAAWSSGDEDVVDDMP